MIMRNGLLLADNDHRPVVQGVDNVVCSSSPAGHEHHEHGNQEMLGGFTTGFQFAPESPLPAGRYVEFCWDQRGPSCGLLPIFTWIAAASAAALAVPFA